VELMDMPERPERYVEVTERLLQLELQNGFFEITVNDVPIWERIRYWTQQKILNELGVIDSGMNKNRVTRSPVKRYTDRIVEAGRGSARRNPYLTTEHPIPVWGHERRKKLDDGKWWDIYFDHLYEEASLDYLHIETKYSGGHRHPAKTTDLRYFDIIEFVADLSQKVGLVNYKLSSKEEYDLEIISKSIADEFDIGVDISGKVEDTMSDRIIMKPLYRRLLHQVEPEIVLLVVGYFRETFVEVCKEENIPVIEVQHGSPTQYQLGYSYPGPREKMAFPDYLFTFGEYWADTVPFPINDDRICPVGYPHLERQVTNIGRRKTKNQIVIISQPAIGNKLAALTIKLYQSDVIPHNIVFKLHPAETESWEQHYPRIAESDVQVVGDNGISLYELFSESTVQIGVYSTAIYISASPLSVFSIGIFTSCGVFRAEKPQKTVTIGFVFRDMLLLLFVFRRYIGRFA